MKWEHVQKQEEGQQKNSVESVGGNVHEPGGTNEN